MAARETTDELSADTFEGFPVFARYFDPVGPRWLDKEDYQRSVVKEKKYRMRDVYPEMTPELHREYEENRKKETTSGGH